MKGAMGMGRGGGGGFGANPKTLKKETYYQKYFFRPSK